MKSSNTLKQCKPSNDTLRQSDLCGAYTIVLTVQGLAINLVCPRT